jgi:hypothetical protein
MPMTCAVVRYNERIGSPHLRKQAGDVAEPGKRSDMPKPRLFVHIGQRFGDGVVIDAEVYVPRPGSSRKDRCARLLCACGNEYTCPIPELVGSRRQIASCGCARKRRLDLVIDRTGDRYGRLTVVQLYRFNPVRWLCRCDCGKETVVLAVCLASGYTKSCGCLAREPKLGPHQAARNVVYAEYRRGARKRGLVWELSGEDFDRVTSAACFYCGTPPSTTAVRGGSRFTYSGIDRKDSGLGYTLDNTVPCCTICNRAKSNLPFDAWMAWVGRLAAHAWFSPEHVPSRLLATPATEAGRSPVAG